MKVLVIIVALLGIALAAPKISRFHNLYNQLSNHKKAKESSGRIINGNIAEPHSIPYLVFLELYDDFSGWHCGGTLITENFVLTAGHCSYQAKVAVVTLGAQKPKTPEDTQVIVVAREFVVHEKFEFLLKIINDIGLVKLPNKIKLTNAIQLATLPNNDDDTYVGQTGKASGWGTIFGYDEDISDVLRYTENPVLANEECGKQFGPIPDNQICMAGDEGHTICTGDSGGPFTVDGVQVGIASYTVDTCREDGYPSAFTRVSSFLDWIAENTSA